MSQNFCQAPCDPIGVKMILSASIALATLLIDFHFYETLCLQSVTVTDGGRGGYKINSSEVFHTTFNYFIERCF